MSRLFVGSAICNITKTGNIAVPDDFSLTIIARQSRDNLYIYMHERMNCLIVVDNFILQDRLERFERRPIAEGSVETLERTVALRRNFGFAAPTRLDSRGQIAIAATLDERRGKARQALLVGMGHGFEIWDLDHVLDRGHPELRMLASLHSKSINARTTSGDDDELAMHPFRAQRSCGFLGKPGVPVQPVHAL